MKKVTLITSILVALSFGNINAQTEKGKKLVGLSSTLSLFGTGSDIINFGFSSVKVKSDAAGNNEPDPDQIISLNFLPKVGYFVMDNLALGLDMSFALTSQKSGESSSKYLQTLYSIGPFIRYYLPHSTLKVFPYFELSGSMGSINTKYDYGDNSSLSDDKSISGINSFGGGAGIAIPLGEKFSFDVLVGYNSLTIKDKEDNPNNERTIVGTLGVKLGFTLFFGKN